MRARQRKKLAKKRDFHRLKQLILCVCHRGNIAGDTEEECFLKIRLILFRADFAVYRATGKPLLGGGFSWVKAADGPDLVWRSE